VSIVVGMDQVEADCNDRRDLWRLLTPDTVGQVGATAGVAEYHPVADSGTEGNSPVLGAAHARPEIYFVLAGTGRLYIPDQVRPLAAGDAFLIPAGTPHTIVGTPPSSLRAFYVSLKDVPA
jgi:mannose-6-phosphate isomerase-like protein (cupin superfamily)